MSSALDQLKQRLYDINALHSAVGVFDWDQQTYMPPLASEARGRHVGTLTRMAHELLTDERTGQLIEAAAEVAVTDEDRGLVRLAKRQFELATKLPADFVETKARATTHGHEVWVAARKGNDFAAFAPVLEQIMDLSRREAEYFGYREHIYDALLDQYEEGATASDVRAMFDAIRQPLVDLIQAIGESEVKPNAQLLIGDWDPAAQKQMAEEMLRAIGFDFDRGRLDVAPHPFCSGWSVNDVRLTNRYQNYLGTAIYGALHEGGHGLYEQNAPLEWDGLPIAGGVSLGVHESQSRLWENIVGRSRGFCRHFLPKLQKRFSALAGTTEDEFYAAVNRVHPSEIRVEADEVTYNMHIMLRFELECDLLEGTLAVKDVPEVWNEKMRAYLGVTPSSDAQGCLQDVHWSSGGVGYFPTYAMGNLLSYQIWECLQRDLGDTDALIAEGNFAPVLEWLVEKVYRLGSVYTPKETVIRVTGKPMGAEDYLRGISAKYRDVYRLRN